MFKKAVQQGRRERSGEAYFGLYVEPLSETRTPLADFFNILSHKEQVQEMIVFSRQVHGRSVTSETGDDAAMLFCEA